MADPLQEALDPEGFDPNQESVASPSAAEPPAEAAPVVGGAPTAVLPPRDPDTGRFTKPNEISPGLRARAREILGVDDADLEGLSAAAIQNHIIAAQERRLNEAAHWQRSQIVADQSPRHIPEPEPDALDLGIDEETGRPAREMLNKGALRGMDALHKRNRDLETKLKSFEERETARATVSHRQAVDDGFESLVEKLGEQGVTLYGTGGLAERGPDAAENRRRQALYTVAGIDRERDSERTIAKKLAAAHATMYPAPPKPATPASQDYGDNPPAAAKPNGKPTVEQWNDGALATPTNRKPNEKPPGRARAIENMARRQAELRVRNGASNEVPEGVPD